MNYYISKYFITIVFQFLDLFYPKKKNVWGFSVHHIKSNQFIENARAVFEEVKSDQSIKKIIFTRDSTIDFFIENAINYEIINLKSIKGLIKILQCKVLFVTHSLSMDYSLRFDKSKFVVLKYNMNDRVVVNLWHGIPIKKLYALWNPLVKQRLDRVKFRQYERRKYAGLICSSDVDSYAMATMFHPIKYEQVWATGLPRNDFLLNEYQKLPKYLQLQIDLIKHIKNGRKLITYAPTYRQTSAVSDASYYQFNHEEIENLKKLLIKHNAIFGFRMHYFRNDKNLFNIEDYIDNEYIYDLGHKIIPEISPVIRESDIVISDYSSVFIESIYIDKPVFAFTYDFENYRDNQDGILYDFEMVFPSPPVFTFKNLLDELDKELTKANQVNTVKYKFSQSFFFNNIDADNSARLIEKIYLINKH